MNESLELPRQIRKFNPGAFQPDEEVIRQFVARKPKLGIVMDILRGNVESPSCQHVLVVAPRGRGKTMLLARVAAEIRSEREFSERLLPIRFMEESQEIFNLTDFWLESLFYLAKESKKCNPELALELQDTHDDLATEWRGEDLEERARATVLEAADRLGRRLVLMVENLQALCEHVDDDFGWKLRGALQSEPQIILLATATSRFKGLDDAREPFFELFRIVRLDPLNTEECRCLWQMVSGDTVSEREVRPLQILTGGNPRLLVIIGEFARHRSLRQLMEELVKLIDDHTEYFRGHLEVFAKTERRVYLAVIDLWQPSTTGEIAARARMDVRAVSALLGRLVERGAVLVEGSGRKRTYAAAERLYSIYYKLRRERDEATVVRNLIHFMAVFYNETELEDWSRTLTLEAAQWPAIREGLIQAIAESPHVTRIFSNETWQEIGRFSDPNTAIDHRQDVRILGAISDALNKRDFDNVNEIVDQFLASHGTGLSQVPWFLALITLAKAFAYEGLDDTEAELAVYNDVIDRFGDSVAPHMQVEIAITLLRKGITQRQLGEGEQAIATFSEMVERFGDIDDPRIGIHVASALVHKGVTLGKMGEPWAAIATFEDVVARFGSTSAPDIERQIAMALVNSGIELGRLDESKAAIDSYDKAIKRFGESNVPEVAVQVARAMINKGFLQGKIGASRAAITTFDEMIKLFRDSETAGIQSEVIKAWISKGETLRKLGDTKAAIDAFDEVIERGLDTDAQSVQEGLITALLNKGYALEHLGESDAAFAIYDEVVDCFGGSDAPRMQIEFATALVKSGIGRGLRGETRAAIDVFDKVMERFGNTNTPGIRTQIAIALVNKGARLGQLGETKAAIAAFDEVVERFGSNSTPQLREGVARALIAKGFALEQLGENKAAIAIYDDVFERFGETDAHEIQVQVAIALISKTGTQIQSGQSGGSLHTCDELDRRLDVLPHKEKAIFTWRINWLRTKALLIQQQYPDAMEVFQSVYAAFDPDAETMVLEMLAGVSDLIANGASESDLVDILSRDREKADTITPLVVALRQRTGETVRAPSEVLEVATDIRIMLEARVNSGEAGFHGTPSA